MRNKKFFKKLLTGILPDDILFLAPQERHYDRSLKTEREDQPKQTWNRHSTRVLKQRTENTNRNFGCRQIAGPDHT